MAIDKLTTADVQALCRSGLITMPPEKDIKFGHWKYRIEGNSPSNGRMALVFTFRPNQAVFITVFKRI